MSKFRKWMSAVLSMTMVLSCATFSSAATGESGNPILVEESSLDFATQGMINSIVEERVASVEDQFEGYPDSYLRVYKQIVEAQVKEEMATQEGSIRPMAGSGVIYSLLYGGIVCYSIVEKESGDTFDVAVTCLDRDRTLDYILSKGSTITMADACIGALGVLPVIGVGFSILSAYRTRVSTKEYASIKKAGGYAQITNIGIRVGNQPATTGISTVEGWATHTKYKTPDNAINRQVKFFPAYKK